MKSFGRLLLALGIGCISLVSYAQSDNPYIDDAYLSVKEVEKRDAQVRAEAEARQRAALEQQRRYEAEQQRLRDEYRQRQREREIDAYNGRLSQDEYSTVAPEGYRRERTKDHRSDTEVRIYGPYSERLARFHTDGAVVVNAPGAYTDYDYASDKTTLSIYLGGSSWYPWYDSFYPSAYFATPYPYSRISWGWRGDWAWRWSYYDVLYAPYYNPYYSPYYPSAWSLGYYGGYYGGAYSYYDGYYQGIADRAYHNHYYRNKYAHGSHSTERYYSGGSRSSYEAYSAARSAGYERQYGSEQYNRVYSTGEGTQSSAPRRSYGGNTRYQGAARLPQESGRSYHQSGSSSSSYERSYSSPSSTARSTPSYNTAPASSREGTSSQGSGGFRQRHR